ncbi:YCF48-related protein, partial [bacterium]|nr:YCF48-related protein [bacterium]
NGTQAQPVIFQSPTEGTSSGATVFHFKETDLSLSGMSHVKFSDATYAIRIGGESNFNTLDIDTVEIKNAEVRADTHNVTQKASGGDSSKTKGKVVLDNVTLDTVTIRTVHPWSEEIDVKNGTAVDSVMYVDDYGGKITTENMTVSNSKYYIGCCDSYLDIKNSTLIASSLNGRNGTTLIQNSRLIGTPIKLNEHYGILTIEDSVIEYNTEPRTFQGGWNSGSYSGEYGIKVGTTIDIKRSTIKGPGSGIGINVQSYQRNVSIKDSVIIGTDKAIQVNGTYRDSNKIEITGNNFIGSGSYNIENLTTKNITATGNYWGSSDESAIKASIFDYLDNIDYGVVDYSGNLSVASTSVTPAPPANLAGQTGPTTMQLSWTANSESDIAGYKVYYDTDGSGYPYANSVSTGSTGTSYTLTGLTTGTTYYAAVSAIDSDGNESWISAEVSGTAASTPTDLALSTQPSNSSAGSPLASQPVVRVTDLEGNLVTSTSPSVTISITSGSGTSGATLLGTTTVNAVDGVATFSDLQINTAGADYTLTVSSSGLTSIVSSAFGIAAGPASTLVAATNPSESAANDVFSTQPVVHITDGNGNIITTATGTVTAAIASGLGTLTGTASIAASSGVATFSGLGIDTKGDDYQLGFSSPGLVSATSGAFNIISATPVSLSFTSSPTGGQAGEASALTSTVLVLDKNGNRVVDSTAEITLEITDDTGNDEGELSGTVALNATNGEVVFSDTSINLVGDNYSVTAASSGLTEATSSTFNITAGSPVALGFVTEPGGAQTARLLETQPIVGFVDSQGNAVAVDNGISISITIKSGTGHSAATLSGTVEVSTGGGYAAFNDLKINRLGYDYQLVASANGYDSVESLPFAMTGLGQVTTAGMKGFAAINSKDRWAVGAAGEIIATTDGGNTWWAQNSPVSSDLYSVDFVNRHLGFAVGDGGVFLRTTNGGHSWVQRSIGTSVNLRRIKFYNPRKGIIAGEGGFIARTENRGLSWSIESSGVTENLHSVSYSSAQRAWAVGQNGRVMRTTNGGKTWSTQTSNTTRRLKSIHMRRGTNRGVAVGAEGRVIRTTDGGETWSEQTVSGGSVQDLNDVNFVNSTTGWAVGNGGTIMRTTDGGATWSGSNPVSADLQAVAFVDAGSSSGGSRRPISKMDSNYSGGIVGSEGSVLASNNSGTTWVGQNGVYWSD